MQAYLPLWCMVYNEMPGLECNAVCSRGVDVDADRQRRRLEAFDVWIWRRMEDFTGLVKVTNEEVL